MSTWAGSAPAAPRKIRSRRATRCPLCRLVDPLCFCAELPALTVTTEVVVVMHRREAITTSNTGRLAARLVGGVVRVRGDDDAEDETVLPEGPRLTLFPLEGARVLSEEDAGRGCVLIVPDGSWAQARRIARRDRAARTGELVTLAPTAASRYGLRRNGREGGLCTLEAVAQALAVLEGPTRGPLVQQELERVLDMFVERVKRGRMG